MVTQELIQGAQAAQRKWRVWASVSLAQYGIESAWGTKEPKGSNNGFGIQALPGLPFVTAESFEYRHGVKVGVTERFAVFKSVADAFDKHGELIATGKKQNGELIYAAAMATTNAEDFVKALAPVYATAPDYATALLALMRADNLCQYDTLTVGPVGPPPPKPPIIVGGSTGPTSLHPTFVQEFEDFIKRWL